ncbi:hypothetical protein FCL54_22390 [Pseudalkalibacillus caeni]|uniref:YkoP-like domain-containing protein n=2 Tax=Exobacillus caeni TaxID=2574798 RepID=A0A5R9EY19_9BACL|nr:hypothetical protein FCL54_22390 [Pseudalkalibacillus caeni]
MRLYLISIWTILDPFYYALTRLTYLDTENPLKKSVLRVRLTKYKGRKVTLSDGTTLNKNDTMVKIHIHNVRVLREISFIKSDIKRALYLYKLVKEAMPCLAAYIDKHELQNEIKGIIGITLINKGYERLGFESVIIKSRIYRWFKLLSMYPIAFLSSTPEISVRKKKHRMPPNYLFMSKQALLKAYGTNTSPQ